MVKFVNHNLLSKFGKLDKYEQLNIIFCCVWFISLLFLSRFHEMGGYGVETDFYGSFAPAAKAMMEGKMELDASYGPGYHLVLILFYSIFNDMFEVGKFVSILSAVLLCFFTFKIVKNLFDSRVAFFSILPLSLIILPWSVLASSDLFSAFLVTLCFYFLFKGDCINLKNLFIGGLVAGYAYLTRPSGIFIFVSMALILLFINPDSKSWSNRLKFLAAFFSAGLIMIVPWHLTNYFLGNDLSGANRYVLIASHFYGRPGVIRSEDTMAAAKKFSSLSNLVFYDFKYFVLHYVGNIYRHFHGLMLNFIKFPACLFVVSGFMMFFRKMNKRQLSFIIFPAVAHLLLCLVHFEPRYYLFIISFFLVFAVYFFFGSWNSEISNKWFQYLNWGTFIVLIFFLGLSSTRQLKNYLTTEPLELLNVSQHLIREAETDDIIIARKPHLGYFSNLKTAYFPEVNSVVELINSAKETKAKYIFYGEIELERRPQFRELLDLNNKYPDLQLVHYSDNPKMVLYKIIGS